MCPGLVHKIIIAVSTQRSFIFKSADPTASCTTLDHRVNVVIRGHVMSFEKKTIIVLVCSLYSLLLFVHYKHHAIALIESILPKAPYPPCLHMSDRPLVAGYPRHEGINLSLLQSTHHSLSHNSYLVSRDNFTLWLSIKISLVNAISFDSYQLNTYS